MDHHVDDDGRAEHGRHGADADLGRREGRAGDQIAEQAERAAAEEGRRDEDERLGRPEQGFHEVRHGDADKGNRPGERRHAGGQDAREQDQRRAERAQVDAHVLRVHLAQLVGPDGLREEKGQHQRRAAGQHHGPHVLPAHAGERAERPVVQVHDVGIVGEGDDKVGQRRADIADHDAADHEQAHAPDLPGDRQHEAHREHRARERRRDQHCRRGHQPPAEQRDHGDRHRQLRAGRDAEDEGARDGVMKKRLQQIPRDRQSPAEDQRRQQPRQADLQQDPALRELSPALQDRPYF